MADYTKSTEDIFRSIYDPVTNSLRIQNTAGTFYPEVANYSALPDPTTVPLQTYLVLASEGAYIFGRKERGLWRSDGAIWYRLGDTPGYFSDANFILYNNTNNTKQVDFDLSGITAGQTRTITMPDSDVNLGSAGALNPVAVQTSNYNANVGELIPCNISAGSFAVTLPNSPADKSQIEVIITSTAAGYSLSIVASGADVFQRAGGSSTIYMSLQSENAILQYQASTKIWFVNTGAASSNFAIGFPGIDAQTPITNADISINYTTMVLTITPPLGYFNFYVDGGGKSIRYRKIGAINFPAMTNTSGLWYFYFNSSGTAVTTQTAWKTSDFPSVAPVYRLLWNASLSAGVSRCVAEYIEYHLNDISADDHQWFHLHGAIWREGFTMVNNALVSGDPNADGRNTVIALTTGSNVDDNLEYTITNSTAGTAWTQDLGNTTAASLNATNSALFQIFTQDAGGLVSFITATRFPFPYNVSNQPEYITSTGTRTTVTNQYFLTVFVYSSQNPRPGEPLKVVTAASEFSTITNARAYTWQDIQNTYLIFATDGEIRPLYRLIFEVHTASPNVYDVGCKYAVLRETQDIRLAAITSTTVSTGSIPASSVTVVPAGNLASTNVQSALEELDSEKMGVQITTQKVWTDAFTITYSSATAGTITAASAGAATIIANSLIGRLCRWFDDNGTTVKRGFVTQATASSTTVTINISGDPLASDDTLTSFRVSLQERVKYIDWYIPGEQIADATNPVGKQYWNRTLQDYRILSSSAYLGTAGVHSGTGVMAYNIYNATSAIYSTAPDLVETAALDNSVPDQNNPITGGAKITLRTTTVTADTTKPQDLYVKTFYAYDDLWDAV